MGGFDSISGVSSGSIGPTGGDQELLDEELRTALLQQLEQQTGILPGVPTPGSGGIPEGGILPGVPTPGSGPAILPGVPTPGSGGIPEGGILPGVPTPGSGPAILPGVPTPGSGGIPEGGILPGVPTPGSGGIPEGGILPGVPTPGSGPAILPGVPTPSGTGGTGKKILPGRTDERAARTQQCLEELTTQLNSSTATKGDVLQSVLNVAVSANAQNPSVDLSSLLSSLKNAPSISNETLTQLLSSSVATLQGNSPSAPASTNLTSPMDLMRKTEPRDF